MSEEEETVTRRVEGERVHEARGISFSFLVGDRVVAVTAPARGELVVGRSGQVDVRLDDESVSRRHARIALGEEVTVEDLGSKNGTCTHDRAFAPGERVAVRSGDVFFVGDVLCVVGGDVAGVTHRTWPLGQVLKRLDERCGRADAPMALLRVRAGLGDFEAALLDVVGQSGLVAVLKPGEAIAVLPGRDATEADGVAAVLRERLAGPGRAVSVGVALHPEHGANAAALLSHATRALDSAARTEGRPEVVVVAPAMQRLHLLLERVALGTINVLLLGETGVGKEVFAARLHALSPRATKPYVKFNCAALSDSLVEAELFGHEKGAFTGAGTARAGLIEAAHEGTLFLDEVGELSLPVQAKLLRVFEERCVRRVGATKELPVDVRFVAATNRNLDEDCAAGRFRHDLYFRLNGVSLKIPPLRERREELDTLAARFLERAAALAGLPRAPAFAPETLALFRAHGWPGNLREMRNVIERAVLLCDGRTILPADCAIEDDADVRETAPPPGLPPPRSAGASSRPPGAAADLSPSELAERERILDALERTLWNQSAAARQLGISRKVLMNRLDRFGLPRPHKTRPAE